jgi:hypothetical protein
MRIGPRGRVWWACRERGRGVPPTSVVGSGLLPAACGDTHGGVHGGGVHGGGVVGEKGRTMVRPYRNRGDMGNPDVHGPAHHGPPTSPTPPIAGSWGPWGSPTPIPAGAHHGAPSLTTPSRRILIPEREPEPARRRVAHVWPDVTRIEGGDVHRLDDGVGRAASHAGGDRGGPRTRGRRPERVGRWGGDGGGGAATGSTGAGPRCSHLT